MAEEQKIEGQEIEGQQEEPKKVGYARITFAKDDVALRTNQAKGNQFYSVKIPNGVEIAGEQRFGYTMAIPVNAIKEVDPTHPKAKDYEKEPGFAEKNCYAILNNNFNLRLQRGVEDKENPGTYKTISVDVTARDLSKAISAKRKEQREWAIEHAGQDKEKQAAPKGLETKPVQAPQHAKDPR